MAGQQYDRPVQFASVVHLSGSSLYRAGFEKGTRLHHGDSASAANLLLAQATNRQKEIAIRLAMRACRWRIVRQVLTESILLAVLGGILGLVLSFWTSHLLRSFIPGVPTVQRVTLDLGVLGFASGVAPMGFRRVTRLPSSLWLWC